MAVFFFLPRFSKAEKEGEKEEIKGESKRRRSSSSTYHHRGIIIRWPQRCHDNTEGGEGGKMVKRREEEWEVALQGGEREFDGAVIFGGFDVSVKKKDIWLTN